MNLKRWLRKNGRGSIRDGTSELSDDTGITIRRLESYIYRQKTPTLANALKIASATGGEVWYDDLLSKRDAMAFSAWLEDNE